MILNKKKRRIWKKIFIFFVVVERRVKQSSSLLDIITVIRSVVWTLWTDIGVQAFYRLVRPLPQSKTEKKKLEEPFDNCACVTHYRVSTWFEVRSVSVLKKIRSRNVQYREISNLSPRGSFHLDLICLTFPPHLFSFCSL